ncbi:MAG: hypothetical protein ACFFBQ_19515 [Promethearchaeota archaeon]
MLLIWWITDLNGYYNLDAISSHNNFKVVANPKELCGYYSKTVYKTAGDYEINFYLNPITPPNPDNSVQPPGDKW